MLATSRGWCVHVPAAAWALRSLEVWCELADVYASLNDARQDLARHRSALRLCGKGSGV
jgi:hypothetical protein